MRLPSTPTALALLCVPSVAFAHHDPRMLGHHWEVPAYINEIHIQFAGMAAAGLLYAVGALMLRAARRRREANQ